MPIPSGTSVPFLGTQKTTVTRLRKVLGKMFPPPTFWAPTLRLQLGGDVEHVKSAQGSVIYIVVYGTAAELRHRHCTLAPDTGNAGSYEAAGSGGYALAQTLLLLLLSVMPRHHITMPT